jgi:hypothetical protein
MHIAPHPPPEVPQRPATPEEIPASAARLARDAQAHGWQVSSTYAKGTSIGAFGQPTTLVEAIAVRLARGPLRAVGLWHDGAFSAGLLAIQGARGVMRLKARELARLVKAS